MMRFRGLGGLAYAEKQAKIEEEAVMKWEDEFSSVLKAYTNIQVEVMRSLEELSLQVKEFVRDFNAQYMEKSFSLEGIKNRINAGEGIFQIAKSFEPQNNDEPEKVKPITAEDILSGKVKPYEIIENERKYKARKVWELLHQ